MIENTQPNPDDLAARLAALETRQAETEAKIFRILVGDCTPDIQEAVKLPPSDMAQMGAWGEKLEGIARDTTDERFDAMEKRVAEIEARLGDPAALEGLQEEMETLRRELPDLIKDASKNSRRN